MDRNTIPSTPHNPAYERVHDPSLTNEELGNKKFAHKRTVEERVLDTSEELKLKAEGYSFREIAKIINAKRPYNISWKQVVKDINKGMDDWRAMYVQDIQEQKLALLAEIDNLQQEAYAAWKRSQEELVKIFSEKIEETSTPVGQTNAKGLLKSTRDRARKIRETRVGQSKFLETIQWCINKKSEVLGLNAPRKLEVKDWRKEAMEAGITDPEKAVDDLAETFRKLAEKGMSKEESIEKVKQDR